MCRTSTKKKIEERGGYGEEKVREEIQLFSNPQKSYYRTSEVAVYNNLIMCCDLLLSFFEFDF